jgi:hypothetical protein
MSSLACRRNGGVRSKGMRFFISCLVSLLALACTPVVERPSVDTPPVKPPEAGVEPPVAAQAAVIAPPVPTPPPVGHEPARVGPVAVPRLVSGVFSGVSLEGVAFDSRSHRLRVVDQDGLPGARFANAAAAAMRVGGIAAVNGGFFTPEGEPLGLVMAGGQRLGAWNAGSPIGTGVWHEDAAGKSAISRREALGRGRAATMRELMQSGPMLVERGRAVAGLENAKSSARTIILWDGGHRWWIGRSSPCTLARCAEILAASSPAGWPVRHALNLDGGRSSELWVSGAVGGGPLVSRPPWNRPVRNFLVLLPRS